MDDGSTKLAQRSAKDSEGFVSGDQACPPREEGLSMWKSANKEQVGLH